MQTNADPTLISVHKDGEIRRVGLNELDQITGAPYIPTLEFDNPNIIRKIVKKTTTLQKKEAFDQQQRWLSVYFQKDLLACRLPDVSLRWINDQIGWGVFTERDLNEMEFIAEYSGKVRKKRKSDSRNPYCFEYLINPHKSSSLTIDAMDQGGISRYINHDFRPNLMGEIVNIAGINHVILYTLTKIPKGTQICYNYGADYWKSRKAPLTLS